MTASRIIPPSNLPPESQPWGRELQDSVVRDAQQIETLKVNTTTAYQQLNTSVGASFKQLADVQNFLYRMPYSQTQTITASGFTVPANTWTTVISERVSVPRLRNEVTIVVTVNLDLNFGVVASAPGVWFAVYPGSGAEFRSPASGQSNTIAGVTTRHRVGQASTSATYAFAVRTGGIVTVTGSLWSATALTPTSGQFVLTYDVITHGTL